MQAGASGANGMEAAALPRPLGDRLVVRPISREEMTTSGLVLPDLARERPRRGKVLAAGPGLQDNGGDRFKMDVQVGDEVVFAKHAGTAFKLDGEDLIILVEKDLLAVISE